MFFVVITRGGAEMIKKVKSYFTTSRCKGTIAGWECQWWKGFLDFSCCRGMDKLDRLDWLDGMDGMDKTEFCQPHILKSNLNSLNYSEDCRVLILNGELNGLYWLASAFFLFNNWMVWMFWGLPRGFFHRRIKRIVLIWASAFNLI